MATRIRRRRREERKRIEEGWLRGWRDGYGGWGVVMVL